VPFAALDRQSFRLPTCHHLFPLVWPPSHDVGCQIRIGGSDIRSGKLETI
jgi:hypothetical protein